MACTSLKNKKKIKRMLKIQNSKKNYCFKATVPKPFIKICKRWDFKNLYYGVCVALKKM